MVHIMFVLKVSPAQSNVEWMHRDSYYFSSLLLWLWLCEDMRFVLPSGFGYGQYGQLGQGNRDNLGDGPNEMGDNLTVIDWGFGFIVEDLMCSHYSWVSFIAWTATRTEWTVFLWSYLCAKHWRYGTKTLHSDSLFLSIIHCVQFAHCRHSQMSWN